MMIVVDTSVWVEHLRTGKSSLGEELVAGHVLSHPFVVGELACGHLRNRAEILALLRALPQAPVAEHDEVLAFVDRHHLIGIGIGWVDAHLLAAARLLGARLWTLDRALREAARRAEVGLLLGPRQALQVNEDGLLVHEGEATGDLVRAVEMVRSSRDTEILGRPV